MYIRIKGKKDTLEEVKKLIKLISEARKIIHRLPVEIRLEADMVEEKK